MFKKLKTPKVEFFTDHEELLPYAPKPAAHFYPEWFKRMDGAHNVQPTQRYPFGLDKALTLSNVNATVKRCPGVVSYMSQGYVVPLWSDFVVQVRQDTIYAFGSNETASVSLHGRHIHFDKMPASKDYYKDAVKFTNPWKVKTPKGWSLLITSPFYHMEERFTVIPGVIESDTYHHMHVNTFFKSYPADHQLRMGMPFIHVIPFQRSKLKYEARLSTEEDKRLIKNLRFRSDKFFKKNQAMKNTDND
ncbi:hypothetical protein [Alteromonas sp. ASW11-130]|uniref:hypothetical protein n=1 Tax=Alteromonas sp. ASW11-130 TaxID=3015775 RepID=UPI002241E04C|nr:hypothetical protein [Alteromonas sp. ASW11-130]MCW8091955.1 hypothetical protein [Alteromonas sp. ASW11-130]